MEAFRGTYKKGGTLQTADYFLANTANENLNFQWQLAYAGKNWDVQVFTASTMLPWAASLVEVMLETSPIYKGRSDSETP
ncbi:MAG: hypothetical protein R2769_11405 [Saprospiraceae bacterium]